MIITGKKNLIIPDVHQDIAWVERIFAQENDCARVVFLGDYFDSKKTPKMRAGVEATCEYLLDVATRWGDRAVFLLGNHDIQYLEAKPACERHQTPRYLLYKCGAAYSQSAAKKIAKTLPDEFWQRARLFALVNGWLLSHAGVAAELWPHREDLSDSLAAFEAEAKLAFVNIVSRKNHPLLACGKARGGNAAVGGLTWQDWNEEFADSLVCPQIVGHTASEAGARQKGRSWCLDGGQTCYALLEGETLTVRSC